MFENVTVAGQRHQRKKLAVHVVADKKMLRKPGTGEGVFIPRSVALLRSDEELNTALDLHRFSLPCIHQGHDRPGGLRLGAVALAGKTVIGVGVAGLAPASVRVLMRLQPVDMYEINKIVVMDLVDDGDQVPILGEYMSTRVVEAITRGKYFRVAQKGEVVETLNRLNLQPSFRYTKEEIQRIGREMNAQALINGKVRVDMYSPRIGT